jgi:hypothetical protein
LKIHSVAENTLTGLDFITVPFAILEGETPGSLMRTFQKEKKIFFCYFSLCTFLGTLLQFCNYFRLENRTTNRPIYIPHRQKADFQSGFVPTAKNNALHL